MAKLPLVVLAAGKGTRLQPLTNTVPKPLLKVQGKSTLEHTLLGAIDHISEIVLVTGYLSEAFEKIFTQEWYGIPVKYVRQEEQKGTAHALQIAHEHVQTDWFYAIYADDYYSSQLFADIAKEEGNAVVGKKSENWQKYGVLKTNNEGLLEQFIEKPSEFVSDIVNTGVYRLNKSIFNTYEAIEPSSRNEMELPDMVSELMKNERVQVVVTEAVWIPIGYPWHLLDLAEYLLGTMHSNIQGLVENGAVIKGKVQLGEGSVIKAGTYIEGNVYIGKNCTIGPNTYIRKFASIDDHCLIGANTEIKGSIVGDHTKVPHLAYVPDSILGNNVNYAAGTITADLKHDGSNVKSLVNGELVDTGKRKFGTVMGDNSKTGINTTIYPGRKIWNDVSTLPGEIVKKDKQ